MSGPNPIGFGEIRAWGELFGHEFTIWEVDAIRSLDNAWMIGMAENSDGKHSKTSPRR